METMLLRRLRIFLAGRLATMLSVCFLVAGLLCEPAATLSQTDTSSRDSPPQQPSPLDFDYETSLEALANQCDQLERSDLAGATRQLLADVDPSRQLLYLPPAQYQPLLTIADDDQTALFWDRRIRQFREQRANQLLAEAQAMLEQDADQHLLDAGDRLFEAAHLDPENRVINRLLGRKRKDSQFLFSEWERCVIRKGRRPEKQLQWRAGDYVEATSTHFRLLTTASETEAKAMLARMELWRFLWRQWAIAYWLPGKSLLACMKAERELPDGGERRHDIILFQDRQQFLTSLQHITGIERSIGYYDGQLQKSFFYLDPTEPHLDATWIHELNHQLFSETGRRIRQPGENANTWLAEGIAIFFESLKPAPTQVPVSWDDILDSPEAPRLPLVWTVGGFEARRLQYARIRWFREGYFVAFSQLTGRGRIDFQSDADLARTYSQAGAMTQFLLLGEKEEYRTSLWEMLTLLYAGRDRSDSLETVCHQELPTLEEQFKKWLAFEPQESTYFAYAAEAQELALGNSPLTSQQLIQLQAPQLFLLQLSKTKVDDELSSWLAQLTNLQQLFLDQTQITDETATAAIQSNPKLQSLDLAGTAVSDRSVQALSQCQYLERLWLTSTPISDQSLEALLSLPALELLDVRGTRLSTEAIDQLRKKIKDVLH